jgi:hypothetical protein
LAIVLDDSMSMRAKLGRRTRFDRAKEGALELFSSTREGDAVAVVLAGRPARVALAATAELGSVRTVLESATPSDRGTDLDGAIAMARGLLSEMPQVDKRVVVLSDLADGDPEGPPVGQNSELPIWIPLPELREPAADCGILEADRTGARILARIACGSSATTGEATAATRSREVAVVVDAKVVAHAPASGSPLEDVELFLSPADAKRTETSALFAKLSPPPGGANDSIEADDVAPVVATAGPGSVAVIVDANDESTATGGAPIVEQALGALALEVAARPLPAVPDRVEDLTPFLGVIVDDPPGLTPEERRALGAFVEGGGALMLALGPHAASAPLGASLEPMLGHGVAFSATTAHGVDLKTADGAFSESAPSGLDLDAKKRVVLSPDDQAAFQTLLAWSDGAPLLARRRIGRGDVWLVTLPFSADASDLPLRPLFLSILEAWATAARARMSPRRTEAGVAWSFPDARAIEVLGADGALTVSHEGNEPKVTPATLGLYQLTIDGKKESRVVAPVKAEINLTARAASDQATMKSLGDSHASVDASPAVALVLLGLMMLELVLRLRARTREASA